MKKTITLFILLFSLTLFSQDLRYEDVIKVDSTITKEELFNRARFWIGKTFNDEKYVIATEDKHTGELSGNGILNYIPSKMYYGARFTKGKISFKLNIFTKDGRYKYIIDSFKHEGTSIGQAWDISYGILTISEKAPTPNNGEPYDKAWNDIKTQTNEKIQTIIEDLKKAMIKTYETNKDW